MLRSSFSSRKGYGSAASVLSTTSMEKTSCRSVESCAGLLEFELEILSLDCPSSTRCGG